MKEGASAGNRLPDDRTMNSCPQLYSRSHFCNPRTDSPSLLFTQFCASGIIIIINIITIQTNWPAANDLSVSIRKWMSREGTGSRKKMGACLSFHRMTESAHPQNAQMLIREREGCEWLTSLLNFLPPEDDDGDKDDCSISSSFTFSSSKILNSSNSFWSLLSRSWSITCTNFRPDHHHQDQGVDEIGRRTLIQSKTHREQKSLSSNEHHHVYANDDWFWTKDPDKKTVSPVA